MLLNPYLEISPIEGLTLRTQYGVNAQFRRSDSFTPEFFIDALEKSDLSVASRSMNEWFDYNWTNTANYMFTVGEQHHLNTMAGFTAEKFANYWLNGSSEDVPNNSDNLQEVSAGTQNQKASGNTGYNTLVSYLGRVMYNFDYRYYLTASVRVDGSSRFPTGNKYATFPSVSAAWRVSNESFMQDQDLIDNMKIRLGWGRVGNQSMIRPVLGAHIITEEFSR